jgi:hypothetical protein
MKKVFLSVALALAVVGSWAFYPKSEGPAGTMMVISNLSFGLNAQASVVTIAPDGTQKEKEVDFSRGGAKQMAANTTVVHKVALAAITEQTRNGWHVVSTVPTSVTSGGTTNFIQTIYVLEK